MKARRIFRANQKPPHERAREQALRDKLLNDAHVVGTPGSGFGAAGEGYFRLSAFNSRANVEEAMSRLKTALKQERFNTEGTESTEQKMKKE